MRSAKLFSLLVGCLILVYGAVGFYFLPQAGFEGDLTRVGQLPESAFGWRKPQPQIDVRFMQQASWQDADVLVIGDSFSEPRVWQSVLVAQGYRVRTEHWTAIRGICEGFMPALRQQGFHGRYVVLEVVERNVTQGLPDSVACQRMDMHHNHSADIAREPPPVAFDPDEQRYDGRLSIGVRTALNYRDYSEQSSQTSFTSMVVPNGVRVARVQNGCSQFSHRQCQDALFWAGDSPKDIDDAVLDSMDTLNHRMEGVVPIWVVVPNKSTAYLYPDKTFWQRAAQRFNTPDMLQLVRGQIERGEVDVYPGNNSHFSTSTYLQMGTAVLERMRKVDQFP
jgi:hypothetical protein